MNLVYCHVVPAGAVPNLVLSYVLLDELEFEIISYPKIAPNTEFSSDAVAVVPTNGNVICVTKLTPLNAPTPILVTLSGITNVPVVSLLILTKLIAPSNALAPIPTTLGIVIASKRLAPLNAFAPILVMSPRIIIDLINVLFKKAF